MHLNIKKTKIMTIKIHNFNMDSKDIEIVKDFTYRGLVISLNGDCSQELKGRLRLRRVALKDLRKSPRAKLVIRDQG